MNDLRRERKKSLAELREKQHQWEMLKIIALVAVIGSMCVIVPVVWFWWFGETNPFNPQLSLEATDFEIGAGVGYPPTYQSFFGGTAQIDLIYASGDSLYIEITYNGASSLADYELWYGTAGSITTQWMTAPNTATPGTYYWTIASGSWETWNVIEIRSTNDIENGWTEPQRASEAVKSFTITTQITEGEIICLGT